MCKIFGVASKTPSSVSKEILELLSAFWAVCDYDNKDRDAAGYFGWSGDRTSYFRSPITGRVFRQTEKWTTHRLHKMYLCHARGAMSDPKNNANNHPFYNEHFAVMHEGWVNNYKDIVEEHDLKMSGDCDSEVFLRLMQKFAKVKQGVQCLSATQTIKCIRTAFEIAATGPTILAVIDHGAFGPNLWLIRSEDSEKPVYLLYSKGLGSVFYCDSLDYAKQALKHKYHHDKLSLVFDKITEIDSNILVRINYAHPDEVMVP